MKKEKNMTKKTKYHTSTSVKIAVKGSSHILHEFRFHAMNSYQTGPAVVINSAQLKGYIGNIKKAV